MRRYFGNSFSALGVRDYRLYAFGQTVSVTGTWMQKLAQAWLVLDLTNSPALLGVTVAMQQVPTLLFTALAGALADRFEKRAILLVTAICGALPALAVGALAQLDALQIWMVWLAAVVQGLVDALDKPARLTVVNDIATPATLTNAVMLNGIIQDSGKVAGPAIAGLLIGTVGISASFFVNALTFVPVIVALMLIHPRKPVGQVGRFKASGNLGETLRYVAARPQLAATLLLMAVAGLLAYNWNVLLTTLARDTFGGDARAVGLAFTCMGLGAVLGGLALAGFLRATPQHLIGGGLVFATILILIGLSPALGVTYVLLFLLGASSVSFRATATSLVQLSSDPLMRGRVTSLLVLATAGTTPLGGPLIGWICEETDARVACAVSGIGTAIAAILVYAHLRFRGNLVAGRQTQAPVSPLHVAPGLGDEFGGAASMAPQSSETAR